MARFVAQRSDLLNAPAAESHPADGPPRNSRVFSAMVHLRAVLEQVTVAQIQSAPIPRILPAPLRVAPQTADPSQGCGGVRGDASDKTDAITDALGDWSASVSRFLVGRDATPHTAL